MRIGLNATCFNGRPSGANQRFRWLYGAVIRRNPELEFVIYEPVDYPVARWFADAPNVTARRTPLPSAGRVARVRAGLGYWRRAFAADALDLFESFHLPVAPAPCAHLLTLHDLSSDAGIVERLAMHGVLAHAFARAGRVIAVSDAVRAEILAFRPGTAVSTVYNGVDPRGFDAVGVAAMRRWNLPKDFVLSVGHLERRKNFALLIDAVAALRAKGLVRPLAIVGRDGGEARALRARIADRGVADLVTLIKDADDAAVRALYAGCRLVVLPSVYEGFGIPLIEAMAARRPLVTSDIAVFREITGGEGSYFPVDDAPAAAAAIEAGWSDPAERARLTANGDGRVGLFAFDRLADQVAAIYADLTTPSAAAIRSRRRFERIEALVKRALRRVECRQVSHCRGLQRPREGGCVAAQPAGGDDRRVIAGEGLRRADRRFAEHQRLGDLGLHARPVADWRDHDVRVAIPAREIVDRADDADRGMAGEFGGERLHPAADHHRLDCDMRRDRAREPADAVEIGVEAAANEQREATVAIGRHGGGKAIDHRQRRDRVGGAAVEPAQHPAVLGAEADDEVARAHRRALGASVGDQHRQRVRAGPGPERAEEEARLDIVQEGDDPHCRMPPPDRARGGPEVRSVEEHFGNARVGDQRAQPLDRARIDPVDPAPRHLDERRPPRAGERKMRQPVAEEIGEDRAVQAREHRPPAGGARIVGRADQQHSPRIDAPRSNGNPSPGWLSRLACDMVAPVHRAAAFSVVIPLYNKRPFVRRTLESVLGQTYPPAEVIVVDDGSTDGGADAAAGIGDDRVRVVQQDNAGPGPARNRGFAEAVNDWVALIDADDLWLPEHLATLAEVRAAFPAADAVAAGWREMRHDSVGKNLDEDVAAKCRLLDFFGPRSGPLHVSSIAIRRSAFARTAGFGAHRLGEDSEFWVRFALDHAIAISARRTSIYVRGTGGLMEQAEARMAAGGAIADSPILATLDAARDAPRYAPRRAAISAYADRIRTGYARSLLYHGRAAEARRLLDRVRAPSREGRVYRLLTRAPPPMLRLAARCYSRARAALGL